MKIVENLDILNECEAVAGDTACTSNDNKMYVYTDKWEEYKPANGELTMSLYDINANIIEQLGPYDEEKIKDAIKMINEEYTKGAYFMMLCHDIRYYTVFAHNAYFCSQGDSLGEAVISCAEDIGPIYDVSKNENGAFEIWVKEATGTMRCLVLFNYDKGVVCFGYGV